MSISTYLSIIISNVNRLNAPINRHRVADWIKNTKTYNILPTRNSLQGKRHTWIESEGMEKDISCKWKQQESRVAIDFKTMAIKKDKEGHYIMI